MPTGASAKAYNCYAALMDLAERGTCGSMVNDPTIECVEQLVQALLGTESHVNADVVFANAPQDDCAMFRVEPHGILVGLRLVNGP